MLAPLGETARSAVRGEHISSPAAPGARADADAGAALLALFLLLPSLYVGWLCLTDATLGKTASFVGLANYARLLADPAFWSAFWNTFVVVNVIVYGELLLGLGIALLFAGGLPWPSLMLAIVIAPYAMSEVVTVVMWKYMFDPDAGIVN